MLIGLFHRERRAVVDTPLDQQWRLPPPLVKYRSPHCVIAGDRSTSVAVIGGDSAAKAGRRVVALCDGRLDNSVELRNRCELPPGNETTDAALIAALYAQAGWSCVRDLCGDFRLVLYDEWDHDFIAAVDFACTRRLWWRARGSVVIVGSNIGELYGLDESIRIHEDYLIERLAYGWNCGRAGPLSGAEKILAGEVLHARTGAVEIRKYWCPTMFIASAARSRREDQCVAEFGHLLRDGVQQRIPRTGAVLCDLSGGLDSSTITAIAGGILAGEPNARLHAMTVSYPGAPQTDELVHASRVAQASRAIHHIVEWRASETLFGGMPENAFYWDEPWFNVHSYAMAVAKHKLLTTIDADIVLSGAGAEPLLCEDIAWPVFLADSLTRGRWSEVRTGLLQWRNQKRGSFVVLVYRACLGPLLQPVRAMRYEGRRRSPRWVTPFAQRKFEQIRAGQPGPIVSRRNVAGAWMAEQWQAAGAVAEQGYGSYAYETRFPYLHKPLVESVLRMPWVLKVEPRWNKRLLRALARELLPPGFASKWSLGADHAVGRALAAQADLVKTFVDRMILADLGLVDQKRFQHAISLAQNGFGQGLRLVLTTLAIELWVRSVLSGSWRRMQLEHLWPR